MAVTAYAEDNPSTQIQFGTSESVYGIDALYTVQTENVKSISIRFADNIGYAQGNYINGKIRISIASADPIDLSGSLAFVTATLNDDSVVAPEIEIEKLLYNSLTATENLVPGTVSASQSGSNVSVEIKAHNDFTGNSYTLMTAAYSQQGQMKAVTYQTVTFDSKNKTFNVKLPNCSDAKTVKVFYLTSNFTPVVKAQEATIQ